MDMPVLSSTRSTPLAKVATMYKKWRERGKVKCFEKQQKAAHAVARRAVGVQVVPVQQIVGSVGRCHDFDREFRLKKTLPPERLTHIRQVMRSGRILPPVALYKLGEEYYVLDGNHRVAVAKEMGQLYLDADVIEYLSLQEQ